MGVAKEARSDQEGTGQGDEPGDKPRKMTLKSLQTE